MNFVLKPIEEYINEINYLDFLNSHKINYAINREELMLLNEKLKNKEFFKTYFIERIKNNYSVLEYVVKNDLDIYLNKEEEKIYIPNNIYGINFPPRGFLKIKTQKDIAFFLQEYKSNVNTYSFGNQTIPKLDLLKSMYPEIKDKVWQKLISNNVSFKEKIKIIDDCIDGTDFKNNSDNFINVNYSKSNNRENPSVGVALLLDNHCDYYIQRNLKLKVGLLYNLVDKILTGDFEELDKLPKNFTNENHKLLRVFAKNIPVLSEYSNKDFLANNINIFMNKDFDMEKNFTRLVTLISLVTQANEKLDKNDLTSKFGKMLNKIYGYWVENEHESLTPNNIRNSTQELDLSIFLTEHAKNYFWKAARKEFLIKESLKNNINSKDDTIEINMDFLKYNLSDNMNDSEKLLKRFITICSIQVNNDLIIVNKEPNVLIEDYILDLIELTKSSSNTKELENMYGNYLRQINLTNKLGQKENKSKIKQKI